MEAITRITRAEIKVDECAENPMDMMDMASTIVAIGRRIYIKNAETMQYLTAFEEYCEQLPEYEDDEPLSDDSPDKIIYSDYVSTQYGYIGAYIDRRTALKEWGKDFTLEQVKACVEGELETMKAWADGEVYGYILYGVDEMAGEDGTICDGEEYEVESCWGYYGDHKNSGILDNIPSDVDIEYC